MTRQAAYVHLQQGAQLLPGAHDLECIMAGKEVVALGMGDHDLAAGIEHGPHDIVVIALQLKPELDQQKPAGQPDIGTAGHPIGAAGIGGQDLLAQP